MGWETRNAEEREELCCEGREYGLEMRLCETGVRWGSWRCVEQNDAAPLGEEESVGRLDRAFMVENVEGTMVRRRDEEHKMNDGVA